MKFSPKDDSTLKHIDLADHRQRLIGQQDRSSEDTLSKLTDRCSEDYISEKEPSKKEEKAIRIYLERRKELARFRLVETLAKSLGFSLIATFLLMSIAAFSPNSDKAFVKDIIPIILGPQITLLSVVVGYYFGAKAN
jgi:hypothetical protein